MYISLSFLPANHQQGRGTPLKESLPTSDGKAEEEGGVSASGGGAFEDRGTC